MIRTFFLSLWLMVQAQPWHVNMREARELAQKEHRHILLNFSGSDWWWAPGMIFTLPE